MTQTLRRKESIRQWFFKNWNKFRTYISKPENVITVTFFVILVATVVVPLLLLLRDSILIHYGGEAREYELAVGSYTLVHWRDLLFKGQHRFSWNFFYHPLINSIMMSALACVVAIGVGGTLAFLVTRTNLPFKKFISVLFIFPYIMPSWSIAMFWENLFKNSAIKACYNQVGLLESLTTLKVPEWMVYGMFPMAMTLGIHYAPFAYILIGGILRNMDANLEEAATILKASRFKVIRKITLPIVMPGIISTLLLVFSSSISSYTVPTFLNKNGKYPTISMTMKSLINDTSTRGKGYVVAIILILISTIILAINMYITGKRKSFTTVTGKSGQASVIKLRGAKYPLGILFATIVTLFSIIPLISFGLESFLEVPGNIKSFTFKYWITKENLDDRIPGSSVGILRNKMIWGALGKSLGLALVVALIAGSSGILIGYAVSHKRRSKLATIVANLAFFPYLIPALSFGAVFFSLSYVQGFTWLNGSFVLLALVGSVKFLPFASRSGTNAMLQVSKEIEEASIIVGTPWWKRMTHVLFPIQKSSFISGYLLPFISTMRELSLFVLIGSYNSLITIVLQNFDIGGVTQITNGINFLIMILIISINLVINKVTGATIDKGIGG